MEQQNQQHETEKLIQEEVDKILNETFGAFQKHLENLKKILNEKTENDTTSKV